MDPAVFGNLNLQSDFIYSAYVRLKAFAKRNLSQPCLDGSCTTYLSTCGILHNSPALCNLHRVPSARKYHSQIAWSRGHVTLLQFLDPRSLEFALYPSSELELASFRTLRLSSCSESNILSKNCSSSDLFRTLGTIICDITTVFLIHFLLSLFPCILYPRIRFSESLRKDSDC